MSAHEGQHQPRLIEVGKLCAIASRMVPTLYLERHPDAAMVDRVHRQLVARTDGRGTIDATDSDAAVILVAAVADAFMAIERFDGTDVTVAIDPAVADVLGIDR